MTPGRSGPSSTRTYRQTTRSGSGSGCAGDRVRDRRTAARSAPRRQSRAMTETLTGAGSRAPRQQPRGPDEHHDDEEGEGQHVAPFEIGKQPAERDDLGEHECRDEAADEIAEPAQHANQEGDRPE